MMKRALLALAALASAATLAQAEGDATKGEKAFKKCMACHTVDKAQNKVGPHLDGVVGRKAAAIADYKYSEAMIAKAAEGLVWDDANITAYVTNPKEFIPKNKMAFVGIKKPEEVADLIAFLKARPAL